jgi:hypothetical protein
VLFRSRVLISTRCRRRSRRRGSRRHPTCASRPFLGANGTPSRRFSNPTPRSDERACRIASDRASPKFDILSRISRHDDSRVSRLASWFVGCRGLAEPFFYLAEISRRHETAHAGLEGKENGKSRVVVADEERPPLCASVRAARLADFSSEGTRAMQFGVETLPPGCVSFPSLPRVGPHDSPRAFFWFSGAFQIGNEAPEDETRAMSRFRDVRARVFKSATS